MKRIVTIILTLLTAVSFAQTANPIFQGSKYYEFRNAVRIDSAFFAPRRDTVITDLSLKAEGMLTYRPQDKSMWYFNGTYWNRLSSGTSFAIDSARRSHDTLYFRYTTGGELAVKMDYYTKAESDERYVLSPSGKIIPSYMSSWDYTMSYEVPNVPNIDTKYLIVNGTAGDTSFTVTGGTGIGDFTVPFVAAAYDRTGNHYFRFFVNKQSGSTYYTDRPLEYALTADTVKTLWDDFAGQHMTNYGYRGKADHDYKYLKRLSAKEYKLYSFYPADNPTIVPFTAINGAVQGGFIPGTSSPQTLQISTSTISCAQSSVLHYLIQQGGVTNRGVEWQVNLGKKNGYLETWVGVNTILPGFAKVLFYLDGVLIRTDTVRGCVQKLTYSYSNASTGKVQIVTGDTQPAQIKVSGVVWYQTDADITKKALPFDGKTVFLMDSWSQYALIGSVPMRDYTERLKVLLAADGGDPSNIINVGRGGMTSAWGKYYFKQLVLDNNPKYVVIGFYINDANSSSSVGNPAITSWNFSSSGPYAAGLDVDGKVTQADWINNVTKWMVDTSIAHGITPIIIMPSTTGSVTQTQTQSAWLSAFKRAAQYYDIETFFTSGVFADGSISAPLVNSARGVIDTTDTKITRGGVASIGGSYLLELQQLNSATAKGLIIYPKVNFTGSNGKLLSVQNVPTIGSGEVFSIKNNGSVTATDYSASATGFTIPPFTITSSSGVVRFSATNSTTLDYLYLADSFRNTIRVRVPLTLQNYSTSALPTPPKADKGSLAYDSLINRPSYYDGFFWNSLARESDMNKRYDSTTANANFIRNSLNFTAQTANIWTAGTVRFDLGSDSRWDLYGRDSATGRLYRIPRGPYGSTFKSGPGGKPDWFDVSGDFIQNQTSSAQSGSGFWTSGSGRVDGNTFRVSNSTNIANYTSMETSTVDGVIRANNSTSGVRRPLTFDAQKYTFQANNGGYNWMVLENDQVAIDSQVTRTTIGYTAATNPAIVSGVKLFVKGGIIADAQAYTSGGISQLGWNNTTKRLETFTPTGANGIYTTNGRTGDYTFLSTDQVVFNVDNTAPAPVFTLPTAATAGAGKWYLITSERRNSVLPVTLSETIYMLDGTTTSIQYPGNSILIVSDGIYWREVMSVRTPGDIRSVTSNVTLAESDLGLICDATSASMTVALPPAATVRGRTYFIKRIDNVIANTLNVDPDGSETIDGASSFSTNVQWKCIYITSDGSNWFITGSNP